MTNNQHTRPAVSRQKKRAWQEKIERLVEVRERATEDVLVAMYEARQDGLSYGDLAFMEGGTSPSGIAPKVAKGEKILKERKGSPGKNGERVDISGP